MCQSFLPLSVSGQGGGQSKDGVWVAWSEVYGFAVTSNGFVKVSLGHVKLGQIAYQRRVCVVLANADFEFLACFFITL